MQMQRCHSLSPCNRLAPLSRCSAKAADYSLQYRAACICSNTTHSNKSNSSRSVHVQEVRRAPSVAAAASSTHYSSSSGGGRQASGIMTDASPDITLSTHPKQVRQAMEEAIDRFVLPSEAELDAKGRVINAVVQVLQRGSNNWTIQQNNQILRVGGIDRVAVAGSAGKNVTVQGQFDVDLVAFVNLPVGVHVDLCDPNTCLREGSWLKQLQQQLVQLLRQEFACSPEVQLVRVRQPHLRHSAVKFTVAGQISGQRFELDCDLVLAPNLATGAGAKAAAAFGVVPHEGEDVADTQCRAALAPVLQLADGLQPAYLRSAWLVEASTEFVQQAAWQLAAAQSNGLSGRVVTSTIRLVKAWVRKGLQPCTTYFYVSGTSKKPMYWKLKSFVLELLVLHAARRFDSTSSPRHWQYDQQQYEGQYVLDLLREVLIVAQEWASSIVDCDPSYSIRDLEWFVELAQPAGKYYSASEAAAARETIGHTLVYDSHEAGRTYGLVVLHPVDPLEDVLQSRDEETLLMWRELRHEAEVLHNQLLDGSWQDILDYSTLGHVFRA